MNKVVVGAERKMMPLMESKRPQQKGVQDPAWLIFTIVDGNYMKHNSISLLDFDFLRAFRSNFNHIAQTHLPTINNTNKLVVSLSFAAGNLLCMFLHTFRN